MYYKTDESGNYLGVKSETNEGWEFFSTTPLPTDLAKIKDVNGVWLEVLEENEQPKEEAPQEVIQFIELMKSKYNL